MLTLSDITKSKAKQNKTTTTKSPHKISSVPQHLDNTNINPFYELNYNLSDATSENPDFQTFYSKSFCRFKECLQSET